MLLAKVADESRRGPGLALTCDVASTCAILYNSYSGHAGCCSTGTDCDIATDCLDYTDVCVTCTEDVSTRSW